MEKLIDEILKEGLKCTQETNVTVGVVGEMRCKYD